MPPTGRPLLELVAVMDRLRSPGGCAWDAAQTHESLIEYLLEECHETIEAIERHDDEALREELGDLLLQVVFHARIGEEADPAWSVDDVAAGIVAKLVRRHPHVFGTESEFAHLADVGTADTEVLSRNWATIKAAEKGRTSVLEGIPASLPALTLAQKSWRRAREGGLGSGPGSDTTSAAGFDPVGAAEGAPASEAELAARLFALVRHAEASGWDAEGALRRAVRQWGEQVSTQEGQQAR